MHNDLKVGWVTVSGTATTAAKIRPGEHVVWWEREVGASMGFRTVRGRIAFVAEPGRTYELRSRKASFFRPEHCGWIEDVKTGKVAGGEPQC
jgi:hypothetical protein